VADAVLEGKASRKEEVDEKPTVEETRGKADKSSRKTAKVVEVDEELADDALLGEATLAKMDAARKVTTEGEEIPAAEPAKLDIVPDVAPDPAPAPTAAEGEKTE
jgi:hypothetical protein